MTQPDTPSPEEWEKIYAEPDAVADNHRLAYLGPMGEKREAFCQSYVIHKQTELTELAQDITRDVSSRDKTISCGKGCTPCCYVYVVAILQECEGIVYYLYRHNAALQHFLKSFARWRQRIEPVIPVLLQMSKMKLVFIIPLFRVVRQSEFGI